MHSAFFQIAKSKRFSRPVSDYWRDYNVPSTLESMTTSINDRVERYTESQLDAVIEVLMSFDVKEWTDNIMENGLCGAPFEIQYLLEHVMKVRSGEVNKDKENDDTQYCDMVNGECENCARLIC